MWKPSRGAANRCGRDDRSCTHGRSHSDCVGDPTLPSSQQDENSRDPIGPSTCNLSCVLSLNRTRSSLRGYRVSIFRWFGCCDCVAQGLEQTTFCVQSPPMVQCDGVCAVCWNLAFLMLQGKWQISHSPLEGWDCGTVPG